jgi:hypothetical protein
MRDTKEMDPAVPGGCEWNRRSGFRFAMAEDRRGYFLLMRDTPRIARAHVPSDLQASKRRSPTI